MEIKKYEKLVAKARQLVEINNGPISFEIEDNCPGDGFEGLLDEDGCIICGEKFLFINADETLINWLEDIVDECEAVVTDNIE